MRARLALLPLVALLAAGCPGAKPPATPPAAAAKQPEKPLVWRLSKSGLGFRLSNADEEADNPPERKVAPSSPLGADDKKRIAARMPPLEAEPDDAKDFALREKSIPAPRPGKTVNEPFPPPEAAPPSTAASNAPLTIERHAPEGPVELAPHLTMTFSQPMVPVTGVDELAKEHPPVRLVPEPPGKWRWLGTRTLMFQPDKRFPMATEYAVEIPAGTKGTSGQPLAKTERWTFVTPPPVMKRSYPRGSSEPREPIFFAEFDQAIDEKAMLGSIELTSGRGSVPITLAGADEIEANDNVRRLVAQAEKGRFLAFKPTQKLPTATSFTVKVKQGAPSAEGPRRTDKDQAFSFSTFGPLTVTRSQCSYGYGGKETCPPLSPFSIWFSNPIDMKTFDKAMVSITPEVPGLKVEVHGNMMMLRGRTKGRTHYDVMIKGGIGDVHQQTMGQDAKVSFDVGSAEPALFGAESDMVVLDPVAKKDYTVYSINEPGLRTRVYAVRPEDWDRYVAFNQEWERPRKLAPPGRLVYDKQITPRKAPDELVATPIDISGAMTGGVGHALVIVEPTRAMPKGWHRPEVHVWVQSTALGLDAMIENDQVTGWATKLADGAPEAGVDVQLLGASSAKTDAQGLARVPLVDKPGRLVVGRKGADSVIVPERYWGTHEYVKRTRLDQVRWLVFDDRGIYKPGEEVRFKGWVRKAGMNRGGDLDAIPNVEGKEVTWRVRDVRWAEIGKGSVKLDAHGGFDFAYKLPGNANLGQAHVEMRLEGVGLEANDAQHAFEVQEFRRPEFEVTAKSSEGPHLVGEHAIATVSATYYSGGGLPNAPVHWNVTRSTGSYTPPNRGDYHFGPEPRSFWWWGPGPKDDVKTETWSSVTNPQGVHRLRVDFDALEPSYPMSLALGVNVEDVNRQSWAGRTSMLVHPADHYVGLKLAKNFVREGEKLDVDLIVSDIDGNLVPGRHVSVKAARIESEQKGTAWEEKEVDVQTCEIDAGKDPVRCSLDAKHGGSWKITAIVKDDHGRKSQTATSVWVMGADNPKDRRIDRAKAQVVPDKKEYRPGETAEVLVIAPFAPAEALLSVRRQGIVHVERFRMATTSQAIKVKLDDALVPNAQVRVDLVGQDVRDDASGAPDPKLPKRPAYASGTADLKVLPTTRTLAVSAKAKKPTLEPGGATEIDIDVKDPEGRGVPGTEVALVVADESVLALTGYKTPDPIDVFYAPRSPDVHDFGMRDRILLTDPDLARLSAAQAQGGLGLSGVGAGGGGRGEGIGLGAKPGAMAPPPPPMAPSPAATAAPARMEKKAEFAGAEEMADKAAPVTGDGKTPIQVRSDFSALAVWAPRVMTDGQGHATVPVKLPDNLTRYRVMALAATKDKRFGSNESTITARLPLMVRPSAPRFLNFGDRFELPIVVQNQTDKEVDVGVVVRATNAFVEEPSAKRVKIPANDRVEVRFGAAADRPGTARFQIGVASGGWSDASKIELPVWTPATTEAFATYGEIDEGAMAQPVKMPANVFTQFGGLEITTSSTQLQALTDAVIYLVKYPFECNEQLASRVLAISALRDVLSAFKSKDLPPPAALEASMKTDFDKLKRRQHYNGGGGFWQEQPWPYLSIHVAHALVRAKEKGYKPDEEMIRRSQSYLRSIESYIPWWYGEDAKRSLIAYALFVRKKMGDADPARAKRLIAEAGGVDKLPIEAVGWMWPTISDDKNSGAELEAIRRHVANRVTETAGAAHFVSGYKDSDWVLLHSDRRADGILLDAMIGDQPQGTIIPKLVKGLLGHKKAGRWTNTQENAFVLLALDRYFKTYEKVTPDFVARVWLGDRFAGEHTFKGRTTEYSHIGIPMKWLEAESRSKGQTQNLLLAKDGPGRLYYRVGMQYAPTDLKLPPTDQGFVVSRLYEAIDDPTEVKRDADGTWRVKAGAKVRVRVTMVNQSRRHHVALVDPIPAGFEPMNPALAVTGEIPKDPKQEAKQSRYWYWARTWYEHQNMRDERVEAFASLLYDGVWDYSYVARATTPGVFVVPPAKAEEMYSPETFGRSRGDRVIVE